MVLDQSAIAPQYAQPHRAWHVYLQPSYFHVNLFSSPSTTLVPGPLKAILPPSRWVSILLTAKLLQLFRPFSRPAATPISFAYHKMSATMTATRSSPVTPAGSKTVVSDSPAGNWQHPRFDEIHQRLNQSTFDERNARSIAWNLLFLFVTFFVPSASSILYVRRSKRYLGIFQNID